MLTKRGIKIIILFILMLTGIICGWYMYQRLDYDKKVFDTDIYTCISPQAKQVIHIIREYHFDELYTYESDFKYLINSLSPNYSFPIIISSDKFENKLFLMKTNIKQEEWIKQTLYEKTGASFRPKIRIYKKAKLFVYSLPYDQFLICTFHKGIFAASKNLKQIEEFIDIDPENTFFSFVQDEREEDIVHKIKYNSPISIFIKDKENSLALNYIANKDSIMLDGYILKEYYNPVDSCIPYHIHLPDSLCLDYSLITNTNRMVGIKVKLNKKY